MTILIIESIIYIFVGIIISFLLRDKEFKKIKRLILLSYLIVGIAVYSILYFILLSAAVLLSAAAVVKFYD